MKILSIIGGGRVGKTLARLWQDSGYFQIGDVVCRSTETARIAVDFIGGGNPRTNMNSIAISDFYMLTPPDDDLGICAQKLADCDLPPGAIVFHCSGATPSFVLAPVRASGARIASVHPIISFADPDRLITSFSGTYCGYEGDSSALQELVPAFLEIGAKTFEIDPANKMLYHSAIVIAMNYFDALMEIGIQTYAQAGVDRPLAMKILEPVMRAAVDNIFRMGTVNALVGPIARGDYKLVARQLDALQEWRTDYSALYAILGSVAVEMSTAAGKASQGNLDRIDKLFSARINQS